MAVTPMLCDTWLSAGTVEPNAALFLLKYARHNDRPRIT
jgi:hypothetical protein